MEPDIEKENPVMTAKEMTVALRDNTKALNRVSDRTRNIVVALLVVLLVFCYSVKVKHDGEVNNCRRGNELRTQIDTKFDSIAKFIEDSTPPDRITEASKNFLDLLKGNLPVRDCGEVGWL